jgi:hypothetical protein
MSKLHDDVSPRHPSIPRLWFGFLAGPVFWQLHLNASYSAVAFLCGRGWAPILHVFTAFALSGAAAGFVVSLQNWRHGGRPAHTRGHGIEGRTSLLSIGGLGLSGFFFFVILVQSSANYVWGPCD